MKFKINKSLPITLITVFLWACVGVEPIVLNDQGDKPTYKETDYEVNKMSEGILYDFKVGIGDWWSDSKIKLSKAANTMKIQANEVGAAYQPFGVNFAGLDFTNVPVVRVRARVDSDTEVMPTLRMDLKDGSNIQTNASPCAAQLYIPDPDTTGGWVEYYFDFNHKFSQSYPSSAKVDQTNISGLQFFFNPGMDNWSGTIYIDEIYVMANKDGSGVVDTDIIIDDFTGDVGLWWPCKKEKVTVSKASPTAMNIHINDGQWDCFGKIFGEVDVTNNPIIRIRTKATSVDGAKTTNIMARFIDVNENSTDLIDGLNMTDMEVGGADFVEYYSVFKDEKENNLYSSQGEFDPTRVNRVIIFINMNKEANFTGDVIVDEIAFVEKLPLKIAEARGGVWGPKASMDPSWEAGEAYTVIDDCSSKEGWTYSSTNLQLEMTDKTLIVNSGVKGSDWEYIEKDIKPLDLFETEYLKIIAKASGNKDAILRFDFVDNYGNVTNARPQEVVIKNNGGVLEPYYLKMKNNFFQRHPEFKTVNAKNLVKMRIYVNGGLKDTYNGKFEIDDISTISIDDLPEEWFNKLKEN